MEQHARRRAAGRGRTRRAVEAGDARTAGAAHARRSARDDGARRRLRRAVAEPAPRRRSRRASGFLSGLRRQPAGRRSSRKPSSSSTARCAKIAACRTCCAPTTRSSTNGWRVITRFPASTARRFRRVTLPNPDQRGGLLAQGAILATTSYPDRTSPVLRGKWLLDNIFGVYVPPPPPDVDTTLARGPARHAAADDSRAAGAASHQSGRAPAATRSSIRPASRSRTSMRSAAGARSTKRASPSMRSGTTVSGALDRRARAAFARCCSRDRERFPTTVTEKLLAYALGPPARVLRSAGGPPDRPRRGGAGLSLVVVDSWNREQSGVPDAGDPHDVPDIETLPGARCCGASAPRSRCRFSMR